MSSARITKLLLLFTLAAPWSAAQQAVMQQPDILPQDNPLQFTIQQTSPRPTLQVDFHNTGKEPLHLCLGATIPGIQEPTDVMLVLTDVKGETFELTVKHPNTLTPPPNFSTTTIPAGQIYSFSVDLKDYDWHHNVHPIASMSFVSGQYTLQASFLGGPCRVNGTLTDKSIYWLGLIWSNTLPFTIPAP